MNKYTPRDASDIPYGYCQCGCGQKTNLAPYTSEQDGWIKGEPLKYIRYHTNRGRTRGVREECFWDNVDIGEPDECWEWQAGEYGNGYGGFMIDGKKQYAHRIAWRLTSGQDIPIDMVVMHLCDNRRCCNPAHLRLGTQAENVADCITKGRFSPACGENAGKAKLTEADVVEIRRLLADGTPRRIVAEKYDVNYSSIEAIDKRDTWKHI